MRKWPVPHQNIHGTLWSILMENELHSAAIPLPASQANLDVRRRVCRRIFLVERATISANRHRLGTHNTPMTLQTRP
jgi:hypothetical protein